MPGLAFVINLDRSADRLRRFMAMAQSQALAIERIPAVDGRALARETIEALTAPTALYPLTAAEVGCFLSHRRAWERLLESSAAHAAIFEDDAVFSPDLKEVIAGLADLANAPDLVQMESTPGRRLAVFETEASVHGRSLKRLRAVSIGSCAYRLNRKAAKALLQQSAALPCAIDLFLFDPLSPAWKGLSVAVLDPSPVIQEANLPGPPAPASLIGERGKALRPKLPLRTKLRKEWRRLRRQALALGATRRCIPWG